MSLLLFLLLLCGDICCSLPSEEANRGAHEDETRPAGDAEYFDYIVVGGGTAGIPLAFTLAEDDKHVLLIERGGRREENVESLTFGGWGPGLRNPDLAQEIRTLDKLVTHVGTVLSGGTAISGGQQIAEVAEYFHFLEDEFGASFDPHLVNESYSWIFQQTSQPMGFNDPYSSAARRAQEVVGFTPVTDASQFLAAGSFITFSLFENDGDELSPDRKRFAADVLLNGTLADPPGVPSGLKVMLRKTVLRVDFDTSGERPRATCVAYVDSPGPPESIDSRANAGLSKKGRLGKHGDIQRACIKPGGMIYLSAGAILTPTLLMNSGIGPAEVVGNIKGVELVKDIPAVGQNLQDRIATTLLVFLDRKIPAGELNVTLGSTTGFQVTGADCPTDFGIGDVSLDCTYVNSEEGSGFKAIDLFLATRVVLPTALRTAPETDFLVSIVAECYDNQDSILCAPLKPVFECFRKVVGFFTFPPVTKSRGSVTVNEGGEPIVFGNFFSDEEGIDISSAVTGLRTTIRV